MGSIASGASGIFNTIKAFFGMKKKEDKITNINSHNTNNTEIGTISVTSNAYRHYSSKKNNHNCDLYVLVLNISNTNYSIKSSSFVGVFFVPICCRISP